jgi:uncharacterized OB-fold protein
MGDVNRAGARLQVLDRGNPWIKPLPGLDPLSTVYFTEAARGRLLYEHCSACGENQHYPRGWCVRCSAPVEWAQASGRGTVYTYTVIRQNGLPGFREEVPYVSALIDLDEGPRLLGTVTDCDVEAIRIGWRVEAYIELMTPELGLPMWRPAAT